MAGPILATGPVLGFSPTLIIKTNKNQIKIILLTIFYVTMCRKRTIKNELNKDKDDDDEDVGKSLNEWKDTRKVSLNQMRLKLTFLI